MDWVLGHYTEEDMRQLQPALDLGVEIIKSFVLQGIDATMNQYNKLGKSKNEFNIPSKAVGYNF